MDKIKVFCCRYVRGYEDGMALSSSEHILELKKNEWILLKNMTLTKLILIQTNTNTVGNFQM